MENMTFEMKGNKLTIVIPDVTVSGSASSSGKTKLVATTRGAVSIDHAKAKGLKLALNLTVPA